MSIIFDTTKAAIEMGGARWAGYVSVNVEGIHYFPFLASYEFQQIHPNLPKESASTIQIGSYWNLFAMAKQSRKLKGCFVECGVYRGGSAWFLGQVIKNYGRTLHLFDTFKGMPKAGPKDTVHKEGDFDDTSLETVKNIVQYEPAVYHEGFIPDTFSGFDEPIAFAHVDVDIHDSVLACCEYLYPRMVQGGVMIFDDYGHHTCPGAREAVDDYFSDKKSQPLCMITGQAIVFKI